MLSADVEFLTRNNLIDYSFLLGEVQQPIDEVRRLCKQDPALGRGVYLDSNGKVWLCGIIDPLNNYDYYKQAEYYAKTVKTMGKNGMSCVPPSIYAPRFYNFMTQ